jgi:4-alpha-glucanotransferase
MKSTNLSLLSQRRSGVLLHISSLPSSPDASDLGVGDLGSEAYRFVDFLNSIGVSVWQTLPINMPHADNSPYQCLSAFAGNPNFISLEKLVSLGLLTKKDISGELTSKTDLLATVYDVFCEQTKQAESWAEKEQLSFKKFCKKQAHWLNDFSLFLALRNKFIQAGWQYWPDEYKNRDAATLKQARKELAHEIAIIQFTQFIFFTQWLALKAYAATKNVYLFGDIPIFVAYDSADVWAHPHFFKLDEYKNMEVVAGVPPDYFCATGQRWGNPHYNWDVMSVDGFSWWVMRMATQNALFDIVRIDHFRGLQAAWEIPASEDTAVNGQWVLAPGEALLAVIFRALPKICLVAEDLGIITPEVDALRHQYNLPGMKILQFAFSGQEDNPYLPHHIEANSVAYTGTHDNDTTLGWFNRLDEHQKGLVQAYIHSSRAEGHDVHMPADLINLAFESHAQLAIIPMQDILELDSSHRMNTPGTCSGNWHWRFNWQQLTVAQAESIAELIIRTGRE